MPAPLAKGLIITASVLIAAGIALYESPQVRQWVNQSRRKIAVALQSIGDDGQPRRLRESSEDCEERTKRREDIIRRNRNELVRIAREEGISVDLDELAKIGLEDIEVAQRRPKRSRADSERSFDDMVDSDGKLRAAARSTGTEANSGLLRKRGAAGATVGVAAAVTTVDSFSDDYTSSIDDEQEVPSPKPFTYVEPGTRESSPILDHESLHATATPELRIDLSPAQPVSEELISLTQSDASKTNDTAQSFYSFSSEEPGTNQALFDEAEYVSTGSLTPRSERSIGVDDIDILSMQNSLHNDTQDTGSEVFSEGGFTDAGFSEADFSELGNADGEARLGAVTPNSTTDVGSDSESEWEAFIGHGHVSQIHS